jgi:fructokinase
MTAQKLIVGVGELLWDVFPTGKQLGGAPANFAYHTSMLGDQGVIASRIGSDSLGYEAINQLAQSGIGTEYVQIDAEAATGSVKVLIDDAGQPAYVITEDVAWDRFEWTPSWRDLASRAQAVCFGSLAQRSAQSHRIIIKFLENTESNAVRIFDVNLRQSYFSAEVLSESLSLASIVKLNQEELSKITELLELRSASEEERLRELLVRYRLDLICMTRGAKGSVLISPSESIQHAGVRALVADTVGSGDAFTAALVHHFLRGASLQKISDEANRRGAWVASKVGAMPSPDAASESYRG